MPSWAGNLNALYGYALFIFNYTLPYYLISFFHFIGFSFITSMKLYLFSTYVMSGIFMYLFLRTLLKNNTAAFTGAIFYQFAPYHLIALHFKIVIGELLIFTMLPAVFFFSQKLWQRTTLLWYCVTSLSISLLIMSHVVIAGFAIFILIVYAIFLSIVNKKKGYIFQTIITIFIACFSSLYVWLTPFLLSQYTLFKQYISFVGSPQIWELLFSPYRWGFLFQGSHGELSHLLGYTHIIIIIAACIIIARKKYKRRNIQFLVFWLLLLLLLLFLITPYSKFLWGLAPFVKGVGSHRLLVLTAFVISILAAYLTVYLTKRRVLFILLISVTILSTILNWGHRRMIQGITDDTLKAELPISTGIIEGHFYANSKWRTVNDPWFKVPPKEQLQIAKGSAEIVPLKRTSIYHSYILSAQSPIHVYENTLFFPGWEGFSNNNHINIQPNKEGIISFQLKKGLYFIEIKYNDLPIYKLLKTISFITTSLLLGVIIISLLKSKKLLRFFRPRFVRDN